MNALTDPPDLLKTGIFTVQEAADLVGVSASLVRTWIAGRKDRQAPVIEAQLGRVDGKSALSFTNLMELRFVAEFHKAGVRLKEMRAIMTEARAFLDHPHPTATDVVFRTDGKKIMGQIGESHGVQVMYDLRARNYEMPVIVMPSLKRDVEFDPLGNMIAWYPRKEIAPNVVIHPRFSFGRPVLRQSHIPAEALVEATRVEGSAEIVADLYDIDEAQVTEAIRFYEDLRQAA